MKNENILIVTQIVDKNDSVLGFFHAWIGEFAKNYEKVTVVCLKKGEHDLPKNVSVYSLGKESGVPKIKYLINFYKYIFGKRKEYDCVFVHMNPIYVVLGGLFWRAMSKKVALWYTHKNVDLKLRLAEKIANIVFTASKESFRLKSKKLQVMGHGVDVDNFSRSSVSQGKTRILSLGRISRIKDIETAILAIKEVNSSGHSAVLDIIGSPINNEDHEYLSRIKGLVSKEDLSNSVNFLGPVSYEKVPDVLKNYSYLLHTSNTGSLDKVVLEAMAASLLVISCNDSIKSIFGNDERLCFEKGDYVSLGKKISTLINIPEPEREVVIEKYLSLVREEHSLASLISKIKVHYEK